MIDDNPDRCLKPLLLLPRRIIGGCQLSAQNRTFADECLLEEVFEVSGIDFPGGKGQFA